jgi:hypothetical protein
MKNLNSGLVKLDEIVEIFSGNTVEILPENVGPRLHMSKYRQHLELILEWVDS